MKPSVRPARLIWPLLAVTLALAACGGSENALTGRASLPAASPAAAAGTRTVSMVVALPVSFAGTTLQRLNAGGAAAGIQAGNGSVAVPLLATAGGVRIADDSFFFGADRARWQALSIAALNDSGLMAGHGVVDGLSLAWTWDGSPARRYPQPSGTVIERLVGPSRSGRFAAGTYQPDNNLQQVLVWEASGSRSVIYSTNNAKAGLFLFDMSPGGLIGGIERDGIVLTPKVYDGFWRNLPIDVLGCDCEPVRINDRAQVLMTPRPGGNGRGYLVSAAGATLLPEAGGAARYRGLNQLGDVVGDGEQGPFVILGGVLQPLNAYADSAALGWRFDTAADINDRRQILGTGTWQGQPRWYLLSLR